MVWSPKRAVAGLLVNESGVWSAQRIAEQLHISRIRVYLALDRLTQNGTLDRIPGVNGRHFWRARMPWGSR